MGGEGGEGGVRGLPEAWVCGHHRHDALPYVGTQVTTIIMAWCHPGSFACLYAPGPAFRITFISSLPIFVPFLSLIFTFPSFPFKPLCVCVSIFRFAFLLSAFIAFSSASSSVSFVFHRLVSFLFPWCVLCGGVCMLVFSLLSLSYTPCVAYKPATLRNSRILWWCVSFLDFLLCTAYLPN